MARGRFRYWSACFTGRGVDGQAARMVAPSSRLHSPARVGRLASPLGRLARRPVPVLGRTPVHAVDVDASWRAWGAVAGVAEGAAVPGVDRVPARWWVLARVGDGDGLRAEVTA